MNDRTWIGGLLILVVVVSTFVTTHQPTNLSTSPRERKRKTNSDSKHRNLSANGETNLLRYVMFIPGRAGSTWVTRMLNRHPSITAFKEIFSGSSNNLLSSYETDGRCRLPQCKTAVEDFFASNSKGYGSKSKSRKGPLTPSVIGFKVRPHKGQWGSREMLAYFSQQRVRLLCNTRSNMIEQAVSIVRHSLGTETANAARIRKIFAHVRFNNTIQWIGPGSKYKNTLPNKRAKPKFLPARCKVIQDPKPRLTECIQNISVEQMLSAHNVSIQSNLAVIKVCWDYMTYHNGDVFWLNYEELKKDTLKVTSELQKFFGLKPINLMDLNDKLKKVTHSGSLSSLARSVPNIKEIIDLLVAAGTMHDEDLVTNTHIGNKKSHAITGKGKKFISTKAGFALDVFSLLSLVGDNSYYRIKQQKSRSKTNFVPYVMFIAGRAGSTWATSIMDMQPQIRAEGEFFTGDHDNYLGSGHTCEDFPAKKCEALVKWYFKMMKIGASTIKRGGSKFLNNGLMVTHDQWELKKLKPNKTLSAFSAGGFKVRPWDGWDSDRMLTFLSKNNIALICNARANIIKHAISIIRHPLGQATMNLQKIRRHFSTKPKTWGTRQWLGPGRKFGETLADGSEPANCLIVSELSKNSNANKIIVRDCIQNISLKTFQNTLAFSRFANHNVIRTCWRYHRKYNGKIYWLSYEAFENNISSNMIDLFQKYFGISDFQDVKENLQNFKVTKSKELTLLREAVPNIENLMENILIDSAYYSYNKKVSPEKNFGGFSFMNTLGVASFD
eukprot:UC4_evm1s572